MQGEMSATTPDGDVLGTLAVAMSKHGMMMPYLSLSKQRIGWTLCRFSSTRERTARSWIRIT